MINHSKKTIAIPPGVTIREQLSDRGIKQKEFALRMALTEKHVSQLLNGKVELTQDVALRLESVLGVPAKFWNNLEMNYREKLARVAAEQAMERDEEIAEKMPYAKMASLKWIPITKNIQGKVVHLRAFFEVARLGLLDSLKIPGIAYRKAGSSEAIDYTLACWAQKARLETRKMSVKPINIGRLKKSIPDIRVLTVQKPEFFCGRLCEIMAGCGVALVFLPHIGGSFLHGASFIDGNRIVIGLTVRGKYADKFWFSMFHEICHVIEGHISDDGGDRIKQESVADTFARNILIPDDAYSDFISRNNTSKAFIVSFAKEIGIAPGILLGRLQKDNVVRYSAYTGLKEMYEITP